MHVLVTGGAGFLGNALVRRLLVSGHRVTALDDFSTGSRGNLPQHPNLTVLHGDIRHPSFAVGRDAATLDMGSLDRIYNLACPASPKHYQADPIKTFETSVLGARNVLALAEATGARVLQASTSEIYGDPAFHPQRETYWGNVNPVGIRSCYDEGKRGAETLFRDYARHRDVDTRIVRIFNTYGPRMAVDDGRVVSNFVNQALRNEPITVYGRGAQTRSFCYVDDLIEGLVTVMEGDAGPEPVNLGNPDEHTVIELAKTIIRLTDSRSSIVYQPMPEDDPKRRRPEISRAKALGWEPRIPLHVGLVQTITWFMRLRERPVSVQAGTGRRA